MRFGRIEVALERVKAACPHDAVWLQPRVHLPQWMRPHSVEAPLRFAARLHQSRTSQHLEVLRNRRLAHRKRVDEIAHRALALPKQIKDEPPVGLRHDLERSRHSHATNITIQLYICQAIYVEE